MRQTRLALVGRMGLCAAACAMLVSALAGPAPAARQASASSEPLAALLDWSRHLWESAQSGDATRRTFDLLDSLPNLDAAEGADSLAHAVSRLKSNLSRREEHRDARIAEVRADLASHAEKGELLKALRAAIEWYDLSPDKASVLSDPLVRAQVDQAKREAAKAENDGRWLRAQALYYHLGLMFEESREFESDVRRLGQRLLMLRLYTPARLHAMRSEQRVEEGEEPLPAFNHVGEDWKTKLAKLDESMLIRSIATASVQHFERVPMSRLLLGGLRAMRTLATTPDLAEAFPGLASEQARHDFIRFLDERMAAIEGRPDGLDYQDLRLTLVALKNANASTVRIAPEALIHEFTNGAFGELDDYSAVIWPDEMEPFLRTTEGTFKGVGIQITLNKSFDIRVVTPLEGTPAARAGIRPGDIIRKVDGDSTFGMSLTQAVDRITGVPGTQVTLTIERPGVDEPLEFTLTREEIPIHSVKGWLRTGPKETDWDWFIDPENRIGYIRLSQFTSKTTRDVRDAVRAMTSAGLKGLILDLRNNPGGLLAEAVGVASLFIPDGLIVTQEDNRGEVREQQRALPGPRLPNIPVAVLINAGSASASEIVAGALQDYRKAILVGERSYGKGSVQNVFMLSGGAAFKLTTQYYRLPGRDGQPGRLIHRLTRGLAVQRPQAAGAPPQLAEWGIRPDVEVEMLPKQFNDAFELRQDADIIDFDESGNLLPRRDRPDPRRLIIDGLDLQLEAALLLVQTQVVPKRIFAQAAGQQAPTP